LFNLAIDSKLRACDLVGLGVRDVMHGKSIVKRAMILQRKTQQPVQFEIAQQSKHGILLCGHFTQGEQDSGRTICCH
jgi:hypothetical protein